MEKLEELGKEYKRLSVKSKVLTIGTLIIFFATLILGFIPKFAIIPKMLDFVETQFNSFFSFLMILLGMIIFVIVIIIGVSKLANTITKMEDVSCDYYDNYKKIIVEEALNQLFDNVELSEAGFLEKTIKESGMFGTGNGYISNDLYFGKYKDISFECSDVYIYNNLDDDSPTTTYFKGQWYIFEFNKEFKGKFQVLEAGYLFSKIVELDNFEQIKTEDEEFNKMFNIFGNNAHSVFYVLTPHIIESIKKLNEKIEGHLLFYFFDSKLHIGVDNQHDMFKPKIKQKINLEKELEVIKQEVNPIIEFIDELKLYNKIFKNDSKKGKV